MAVLGEGRVLTGTWKILLFLQFYQSLDVFLLPDIQPKSVLIQQF